MRINSMTHDKKVDSCKGTREKLSKRCLRVRTYAQLWIFIVQHADLCLQLSLWQPAVLMKSASTLRASDSLFWAADQRWQECVVTRCAQARRVPSNGERGWGYGRVDLRSWYRPRYELPFTLTWFLKVFRTICSSIGPPHHCITVLNRAGQPFTPSCIDKRATVETRVHKWCLTIPLSPVNARTQL